jgi:hypothetical protein
MTKKLEAKTAVKSAWEQTPRRESTQPYRAARPLLVRRASGVVSAQRSVLRPNLLTESQERAKKL